MNELEAALAVLARVLAPAIADLVVARLGAGSVDLIDQFGSPLGQRRHCAAVTRLLNAGQAGAARVGRRALLTPAALQAELNLLSKRPARVRAKAAVDRFAEFREVLPLRKKAS